MANGNSDMPSGNGFDPMAQYARLSERVENQGKDIVDLRSNMNTGCQSVKASLTTLSNELRSNSKTQWPVIWAAAGVCIMVLATGGAFFYNSLSKGQDRLDAAVVKNAELQQASVSKLADTTQQTFTLLADKVVTQKELEWRTARGQEDRARMEANVADIRPGLFLVPSMNGSGRTIRRRIRVCSAKSMNSSRRRALFTAPAMSSWIFWSAWTGWNARGLQGNP
jgi:hypothetical protein